MGWAARLLGYYEGVLARGEVLPPAAALAQGVRMASLPAHVVASVLSGELKLNLNRCHGAW